MNSQEHSENPESPAEGQPGIEGVDVAGGMPSPSHEGSPDSNGHKPHGGPSTSPAGAVTEEEPVSSAVGEELQREIASLKDAWARERAEFQNYKRRVMQEMGRMKTHAVADFVAGLLPVLDNLDSVLHVTTENVEVKQFVSGVAMIQKELISLLERHSIKIIRPAGEVFNPESMEAIAFEERDDLERDTVLEVFQDGLAMEFEDGLRQVLRPARVRVGRPAGNTKKEA